MGEIIGLGIMSFLFLWGLKALNNAAGKSLGKKVKCPYCQNYGMLSKSGRYYMNGNAQSDWICPHCSRTFSKRCS